MGDTPFAVVVDSAISEQGLRTLQRDRRVAFERWRAARGCH